ncbi:MAG: pirin family protein [Desulfobacula sp.]|jgi:redox-sensitive bicupin YhaK (pirin superfamily)|uniref:pirin family protein n=1 Tax=Desulfobacula sp. TaxID=2593537 RepID=UPI001D7D2E3F|nr:pirin family protein [Desulfobacula sp.]MBT3484046.1 pirin family protein [Desulfobacula sp.]MBT3805133.1 pirin family protein [Desulfobacula sp.]MBT4026051.1 pirin family protein [Desulfobacula sp.]MBT4199808.1 pirin family protein [Desulfobacula sp.]
MINIIKSKDRHFSDMGWLKTYWLFSFSNYHDPRNISHGMLRVFNDDVVEAHAGFDTHPHEEMEIVSIILDGEMTHKDTMGNETVIRKNDVQRMTAGTGLYHSEKNLNDKPVHFYQIWVMPDKNGLDPSYDQKTYNPELWKNKLAIVASNKPDESIVKLNTDTSLYRAQLDKGKAVDYHLDDNRMPYIYVISGQIEINGEKLEKNDQARISNENKLSITAFDSSDLILIDVPA